nr:bifunctional nuclease family protein [Paludibacter sp.]
YDMVNDVFYSELHIQQEDKTLIVDARTSDAVALAVRSECPIYIKSEILEIVGTEVELPEVEETKENEQVDIDNISSEDLNALPLDVLEELLRTAVAEEKYELAVSIRDAIERKK